MMYINVLIADNTFENALKTKDILREIGIIKNVWIYTDGEEAYEAIKIKKPNVVISEINLSRLDIFNIMRLINIDSSIVNKPKFIVLTELKNSSFIKKVFDFGADSIMLKPIDKAIISQRIKSIVPVKETSMYKDADISRLICSLGISARLKGYRYIKTALKIMEENEDAMYGITKNLYPEIAKIYSTTAAGVERAIRNAITISWERCSSENKNLIFGNTINPERGRPTNYEMLSQLSAWMRGKKRDFWESF